MDRRGQRGARGQGSQPPSGSRWIKVARRLRCGWAWLGGHQHPTLLAVSLLGKEWKVRNDFRPVCLVLLGNPWCVGSVLC